MFQKQHTDKILNELETRDVEYNKCDDIEKLTPLGIDTVDDLIMHFRQTSGENLVGFSVELKEHAPTSHVVYANSEFDGK